MKDSDDANGREIERLARVARNRADAAPVVEALRKVGIYIDTIADLFNKKLDYRAAIPILIEWLPRVTNVDVKEAIIRALSVKWARRTVAPKLLAVEFERAENERLRWAIGNALEVLASEESISDMIKLAKDQRYGRAREMVVLGLGKLQNREAIEVLVKLLEDEDVVGHAVIALGRLRAKAARAGIEAVLNHPKGWVRKEAERALTRIDRGG